MGETPVCPDSEADGTAWALRTPGELIEKFIFNRTLDAITAAPAVDAEGKRVDRKLSTPEIPKRVEAASGLPACRARRAPRPCWHCTGDGGWVSPADGGAITHGAGATQAAVWSEGARLFCGACGGCRRSGMMSGQPLFEV